MPNWVQNEVSVTGDAKIIEKMLEQIKGEDGSDETAVDFNKIIPMPESLNIVSGSSTTDGMALYLTALNPKAKHYIPESIKKLKEKEFDMLFNKVRSKIGYTRYKNPGSLTSDEIEEIVRYEKEEHLLNLGQTAIDNIINYGCSTWYDWCCENWGTKWNACESYVFEDKSGFGFQTAWSAAFPIIEKLSEMYPKLTFELNYADEDIGSNCGNVIFEKGETQYEYHPDYGDEGICFACDVWGYDADEYLEESDESIDDADSDISESSEINES